MKTQEPNSLSRQSMPKNVRGKNAYHSIYDKPSKKLSAEALLTRYYLKKDSVNKANFIKEFIDRYIVWSYKEDSYRWAEFLEEECLNERSFHRYMADNAELQSTHEEILARLGNRMWKDAAKRDVSTIHKILGAYCTDWKEQEDRRAQLATKENPQNTKWVPEFTPLCSHESHNHNDTIRSTDKTE